MAVTTAHEYNHMAAQILGQQLTLSDLALMLLADTATFTATHASVDDVAGPLTGSPAERIHEVYGNGWAQGGETVASVVAATVATNGAKLSGDQTSREATGGNIGPCRYVLLYDKTSMKPIVLYDLGQDEYAGVSTPFKLTFDLNGEVGSIFQLQVINE